MTIKDYLAQVKALEYSIENKKDTIISLRDLANKTTQNLTGMPHVSSQSQSRVSEAVCKMIDVEQSLREDEAALVSLKMLMRDAIEEVEPAKYRKVLYKRYVRDMSIDAIGDELLCSARNVQRLLAPAKAVLEIILEKK